jgi:two-component sensor histidine kinase
MALSRAHELLTRQAWGRADLHEILATALSRSAAWRAALHIAARPWTFSPETAVALHMTLHELMVNAAKHGALSTADRPGRRRWRDRG